MLVANILPVGVRGLVVAGLLAALMSSLAGAFNAASTLFTMDFYQRLRPKVTQERLVWVGRVATGVMVLIGLSGSRSSAAAAACTITSRASSPTWLRPSSSSSSSASS